MAKKKKIQEGQLYTDRDRVSEITFKLYILFICSFFLHLSARIPGIGVIRPDLLIVILITILLFSQSTKFEGRLSDLSSQALNRFLFYFLFSLPFVEWPGSVISDNIPTFVKSLVFFYFTVLIIDTQKRLTTTVFVFMVCQVFRILEPLYLNITEGYLSDGAYIGGGEFAGRLGGAPHDVVNPNGLALVIASLFPFLHFIWGSSSVKWKMSYYALIAPLLYVLVLTLSRSGFIALSVVAWQIFVRSKSRMMIIVAVVVICIAAWANMTDIQRARYLSLTSSSSASDGVSTEFSGTAQGRIDAWFSELDTFMNKPLVGHGVGTSAEAAYHTRGKAVLSHNLYTEILVEMGLLGFIFFMIFLKSIYKSLKSNVALIKSIDPEELANDPYYSYYENLLSAIFASFWMYLIFSFAQYGLREFNWYFLGGLSTVLTLHINNHIALNKAEKEDAESHSPASNSSLLAN